MKKLLLAILLLIVLVGCGTKSADTCNILTGECEGAATAEGEDTAAEDATADTSDEDIAAEDSEDTETDDAEDTTADEDAEEAVNETAEVKEEPKAVVKNETKTEPKKETKVETKTEGNYSTVITVKEGELVKLSIKASDDDKDTLEYTYSKPLNEKGEWQTAKGDKGEYPVTISVGDGKTVSKTKILVIVKSPNEAPIVNILGTLEIEEGQTVTLTVNATDPENDKLNITVSNDKFKKDGNKFSWQTGYEDAGTYTVKFDVRDAENVVKDSVEVKVKDLNRAPVIKTITQG